MSARPEHVRPLPLRQTARAIAMNYGDKGAIVITYGDEGIRAIRIGLVHD